MVEHEINELNNFICGWYLDDPVIDKLIEYHKNAPHKKRGITLDVGSGFKEQVDSSCKDSIDALLLDSELFNDYMEYLDNSTKLYIEKYQYCNYYNPWNTSLEIPNIQYYPPGGGFFRWHCERGCAFAPMSARHLVFMTYLNDVNDGGETEFYHQKLKIKPERGLTLIWPADWTFTHRGIASPTKEKYIITGWFNFTV